MEDYIYVLPKEVRELRNQGMAVLSNLSFKIERVSVSNATSARTHHYHNSYELCYPVSRGRYYFIKDKTYHVKPGSFVLVKPYDIHSTVNLNQDVYDRITPPAYRRKNREVSQ